MPANKNAMTRYMILDDLLSCRYHNYSLDDLTQKVSERLSEMYPDNNGVSRRQIEKDLHYLEYDGPFYVDIERYTSPTYDGTKHATKRCLRYKTRGFSIFKKALSDNAKYLLSNVLSLLGQFDGLPDLDGLEDLRAELEIKDDRRIVSFTRNPLENSNLFGKVFTAISQSQVIQVEYKPFGSGHRTITVHPYLLKEYNRRWFLFAAKEGEMDKILNLGLERINEVTPLPGHKYCPYAGDIEDLFDDIIGVTLPENMEPEHILFWVSERSQEYVATKPLHESQIHYKSTKEEALRQQFPQLTGGSFFSIDCIKNYELIRELSSFGKELMVLQPIGLRNEIIERLDSMLTVYKDSSSART